MAGLAESVDSGQGLLLYGRVPMGLHQVCSTARCQVEADTNVNSDLIVRKTMRNPCSLTRQLHIEGT